MTNKMGLLLGMFWVSELMILILETLLHSNWKDVAVAMITNAVVYAILLIIMLCFAKAGGEV